MSNRTTSRNNNPHLIIPQDSSLAILNKERGLLLLELRNQCKQHRISQKEICAQLGLPKNFFKNNSIRDPKKQKYQRNKNTKKQRYISVFVGKDYPGATKQGTILEHRKIMSEHLGRTLEKWEVVHHKNRDKTDNRIENLEVLTSASHPTCIRCPYYLELQELKKKYRQ